MKLRSVITLLTVGFVIAGNSLAAGDSAAGKAKANVCAGCHGMDGYSSNELWPNLAGQKNTYLVVQIKAFRDGVRKGPLMQPMVANLSDQDIDDLAAYYSGLE